MITASTQPPKKPAIAPSAVPTLMIISTAVKPTLSETRAPTIRRA